jgi:hypothetical protein
MSVAEPAEGGPTNHALLYVANGAVEAVAKPFDIRNFIAMLDCYFPFLDNL